jgi:hypothetical protein
LLSEEKFTQHLKVDNECELDTTIKCKEITASHYTFSQTIAASVMPIKRHNQYQSIKGVLVGLFFLLLYNLHLPKILIKLPT